EHDGNKMVGRLDWVTKRHLLAAAGREASVAPQRKADVRYHELSQEGYYLRLEAAGAAPTLVEPEAVLHATTVPPAGTPAEARGRLIQEHAPQGVRAGGEAVIVRRGRQAPGVRLTEGS